MAHDLTLAMLCNQIHGTLAYSSADMDVLYVRVCSQWLG